MVAIDLQQLVGVYMFEQCVGQLAPTDENHMQQIRRALQEEAQRCDQHGIADTVEIVDEQHDRPIETGQLVDQQAGECLHGEEGQFGTQAQAGPADLRSRMIERCRQIEQHALDRLVLFIQRQPGHRMPLGGEPVGPDGGQGGLAEPGRRLEQRQTPLGDSRSHILQSGTGQDASSEPGWVEFGRQ